MGAKPSESMGMGVKSTSSTTPNSSAMLPALARARDAMGSWQPARRQGTKKLQRFFYKDSTANLSARLDPPLTVPRRNRAAKIAACRVPQSHPALTWSGGRRAIGFQRVPGSYR